MRNASKIVQNRSERDSRWSHVGFVVGAAATVVVVGAGIVGATQADKGAEDPIKSPEYCKVEGRCGDGVYKEPSVEREPALVRFEEGKTVSLGKSDVARVTQVAEGSVCPVAAAGARTIEESRSIGQRVLESGDFEAGLRDLWSPDALKLFAEDVRSGEAIAASVGRFVPVSCQLDGFQVVKAVEDSTGLVVQLRYQIRRQFTPDTVGKSNVEELDKSGLSVPNEALQDSYLYEFLRSEDGSLVAISKIFYRDPKLSGSGI